ncbi:MAG: barstar family protein [Parasphingopyxis sp.]|uniref:barstar family protein n=1 Tax=Parasphingopyxis sp. TaxID=1920299 RepID=UPI0032ECBC18
MALRVNREILLHPAQWGTAGDFYHELLTALEAPEWHGQNMDAVADSLVGGQVNGVEPPFTILLYQAADVPGFAARLIKQLEAIASEATASGRPISVQRR